MLKPGRGMRRPVGYHQNAPMHRSNRRKTSFEMLPRLGMVEAANRGTSGISIMVIPLSIIIGLTVEILEG